MNDSSIIKLENVWKVYKIGNEEVNALSGVNLSIRKGEFVSITGASGSGKSTMMNLVGVLDMPTKGSIYLEGQDISKLSESKLAEIRGKKIGFIFQQFNLIPTLTALENVMLPMEFQDDGDEAEKAMKALELVGLKDRVNHKPNEMSGGQAQRVAIARALVNNPEVILADEPTGNLDSNSGAEVIHLLQTLNRERNTTILVVTHDRHVARATQRILTMSDGRIVDEHPVRDHLTEDLRELALSRFGQNLIAGDVESLSRFPVVRDGRLTQTAEQLAQMLSELL